MNWVFGNLLNICINNCKYTNIEIHTCKTMGIHGNMIHGDTDRNNSIRSNEGTVSSNSTVRIATYSSNWYFIANSQIRLHESIYAYFLQRLI